MEIEYPPVFDVPKETTNLDMDLIEILWHQDIDLGIGRDGFDANLRQELEKERELEELKKEENPVAQKSDENVNDFDWESYTVDAETGELIPTNNTQQQNRSTDEGFYNLNNNEESISIVDALEQISSATPVPPQNQTNTSLTELLQTGEDQLDRELKDLMNRVRQNDTQFDRQTSIEQRWNDISSLLNLTNSNNATVTPVHSEAVPEINMVHQSTPDFTSAIGSMVSQADFPSTLDSVVPPLTDANSALIHNASFAPVSMQPDYSLPALMSFDTVNNTLPSVPVTVDNTSPSMYYGGGDDSVLFPDVANMVNESYYDQSDFLADMVDDGLDNEIAEFALDSHIENLQMCDVSDDSAVSSMGSVSPNWNDTMSVNSSSGMTSPFDGLEGATGGSYDSTSTSSGLNHGKYEYSNTAEDYYIDDSDVEMNITSNQTTSFRPAQLRHVSHNHSYPLQPGQQPRERKSDKKDAEKTPKSRDEKRIKALKIPFTLDEIISSPVDDFNEMLKKHKLSEEQMSVMRDIRRRGKNKVAAQNCRKRKMTVVVSLEDEVDQLKADKQKALKTRNMIDKEMKSIRDKYEHLYQEMFRSLRDSNGLPYDPNSFELQHTDNDGLVLVPANSIQQQRSQQRVVKKRKGNKKN